MAAAMMLPLFPLSNVVLFPGVRAPLHIFEPRYRQMMEAALAADRTIGMVTVIPEHAADISGDPPIFPVGCAGFIRDYQRLADGRFNLVLQGTLRFRITDEHLAGGERLYRTADVEMIGDDPVPPEDGEIAALRSRVASLVAELVGKGGDGARDALAAMSDLDDERFVNELCRGIGLDANDKQGLLEADGARARLAQLEGVLQFRLAAKGTPSGGGSGTVH